MRFENKLFACRVTPLLKLTGSDCARIQKESFSIRLRKQTRGETKFLAYIEIRDGNERIPNFIRESNTRLYSNIHCKNASNPLSFSLKM